jgi:hypothetical protein
VRLACFGDVHMALGAVAHLAPELGHADVAIGTGDITNFGDPPDAFRVVDRSASVPSSASSSGMPGMITNASAPGVETLRR